MTPVSNRALDQACDHSLACSGTRHQGRDEGAPLLGDRSCEHSDKICEEQCYLLLLAWYGSEICMDSPVTPACIYARSPSSPAAHEPSASTTSFSGEVYLGKNTLARVVRAAMKPRGHEATAFHEDSVDDVLAIVFAKEALAEVREGYC
eukprot:6181206-Pleurochrysis_carterae.AAC.9